MGGGYPSYGYGYPAYGYGDGFYGSSYAYPAYRTTGFRGINIGIGTSRFGSPRYGGYGYGFPRQSGFTLSIGRGGFGRYGGWGYRGW
ncbi:MAG: spore coat protein [Planctomycetota bacterium]|nr:spore coat protein [Planctomycetota bacterium]